MDTSNIEQIRNATFSLAKRGYEPSEVDRYLTELADWLERDVAGQNGSAALRRELERVSEKTTNLLAQAEESADRLHAEAVREASVALSKAREQADEARRDADEYSTGTRTEADEYARRIRTEAEEDARTLRAAAAAEVQEATERAASEARNAVESTDERRGELEAEIGELTRVRDEVLADLAGLSGRLEQALDQGAGPAEEPEEDLGDQPSYGPGDSLSLQTP